MKTVCITGAAGGIGRAIALKFALSGYNLILTTGKNIESLNSLCDEIKNLTKKSDNVYAAVGDISDPEFVASLINAGREKFGTIDVLINNAGISYIGLISDMSYEDWRRVIDTNLTSMFLTVKEVLPSMLHDKSGVILNISSMWGVVGASCEVAYSASKGGVNAYTKALAKELAPSNIRVNALALGCIDTKMNGNLSQEERDALQYEIPIGRFASPSEVAEMAYNVATGPSYLTGSVISFDGGWI